MATFVVQKTGELRNTGGGGLGAVPMEGAGRVVASEAISFKSVSFRERSEVKESGSTAAHGWDSGG